MTKLIPPLLALVDEDKLSFSTAADYIAILTEQEQTILALMTNKLGAIPTRSQLVQIKERHKTEVLTVTVIESLLSEECPITVQVVLKQTKLSQYFPQDYTAQQMEEIIVSLLETWSVQHK